MRVLRKPNCTGTVQPYCQAITPAQYGRFQERLFEFRGFYVEARTVRTYPLGVAAHAIGFLGEVNDEFIKHKPLL